MVEINHTQYNSRGYVLQRRNRLHMTGPYPQVFSERVYQRHDFLVLYMFAVSMFSLRTKFAIALILQNNELCYSALCRKVIERSSCYFNPLETSKCTANQ